MLAQRDGKILVGGEFTAINSIPRGRIARLTSAGLLDRTFAEGAGANSYIDDILQQADGKIVVVGDFTSINGQGRERVARLEAALPRDIMAPTIVLNGANPMELAFGSVFTDPGARVVDDSDAERTIFGSGAVNTGQAGTYTLTYVASDAAGNPAAPVVRAVHVTAISMLKPLKDSVTIKSGKKSKAVILLSNNTRAKVPKAKEEGELEIEVLSGAGLVTVPGKLPFKAAHKSRDTSPPKITRVNLIVTAATGQTGQATLVIRYNGRTAQLNVIVK